MITLPDYFAGHDEIGGDLRRRFALDLTPQIEHNAEITVGAANLLLTRFHQRRGVNSGWRPPSYNAKVPGAARNSLHMTGQAIDIEDNDGALDDWCMGTEGERALTEIGLWHEHPSSTMAKDGRGAQCHVQTVPPPSGNRHFYR